MDRNTCLVFALVAAWCAPALSQTSAAAGADARHRCESLQDRSGPAFGDPTVKLTAARLNAPSDAKIDPAAPPWMGPTPPMPEHCEVTGSMRERVGTDGQRYAVRFRVRLPTQWNGRFLFQGGGGTNGIVGNATGVIQPGMKTGLELGYAVVSTDTGHDNATNSDPAKQGTVAFGHDYQARLEYAEKALDSVALAAKHVVQSFYGRPASRNYFVGCSNGGREGMIFAQRFPEHFDGIVAAAPAFAVPKAAIAEAWDTQTFSVLAQHEGWARKDGLPDIARVFSEGDMRAVADAVTKVCDADDGAVDGMIQDPARCTTARVRPALEAHACAGTNDESCLSREEIDALVRSLDGPRNSQGQALYVAWPWDPGIGAVTWRIWKTGMPGAMDAINIALGSPALSGLFITPPRAVAATVEANLQYQLAFDFDRDAPTIFATTAAFPRSGWDLIGARATDLARFRQRGARLIVPHGSADPIFSINDTFDWWRQVDAANAGNASDFVRVYAVPGMNHCGGGPATDQFDALAALVDWVENGHPPDRIEARAGPMTPWPGRTRPLCTYPKIARYRSGDLNRSESFVCE